MSWGDTKQNVQSYHPPSLNLHYNRTVHYTVFWFPNFIIFTVTDNNNDKNFPFISIENCPEDLQNFRSFVKKIWRWPMVWREQEHWHIIWWILHTYRSRSHIEHRQSLGHIWGNRTVAARWQWTQCCRDVEAVYAATGRHRNGSHT